MKKAVSHINQDLPLYLYINIYPFVINAESLMESRELMH